MYDDFCWIHCNGILINVTSNSYFNLFNSLWIIMLHGEDKVYVYTTSVVLLGSMHFYRKSDVETTHFKNISMTQEYKSFAIKALP